LAEDSARAFTTSWKQPCTGSRFFFGPHFQKFREAVDLLRLQGAVTVVSSQQLINWIGDYSDPAKYTQAAEASASYVSARAGATEKIIASLE
jgi:3-deoxy-D-manno-octulosonic-acid transferase